MALSEGTRLGEYDVLSRLGAGGMGEVYRAHDTKLGRDVALKLLPETFAGDAERVARFRREAQLLAGLQHPHISGIYGIQDIDRHHLLVLELVGGGTLADRIQRGPLPVDEALAIAREIAQALEAAHERGVVHRDLKPSNIGLTADGTVKVLDFGLARATVATSGVYPAEPVNSPTITSPLTLTAVGVILGTAAYMSPEQARGAVADRRSDVWAFGCVVYEMLTGSRAFPGENVTDTLAAVVQSQPDWSRLPAGVTPAVRALLEGCLEKDRRKRIGDLAAARFVLERAPALTAQDISAPRRSNWPLAVFLLGAAAVAAAATSPWLGESPQPAPVTRFTIPLPPGHELSLVRRAITISPDGERILYAANGRLFVRRLSDFESQPIGESGIQPTFSPDGQTFAFFSEGALKRASVAGGVALPVRETAPAPYGISWGPSGILLAESARGIIRASPNGGAPSTLVPFNERDGLTQGVTLLPDGDTLLFARAVATSTATFWDSARIVARSLRTGEERVVIEGGSNPLYVGSGHIVYLVEGTLMAVAFDPARRAVIGTPAPVVAGVRRTAAAAGGEAQCAVSASGTLAYVPGPARSDQESMFLYGNDGSVQAVALPPGRYDHPRVSPDGQRLALEIHDGKESWIAIYHLSGRTAAQRLTFGGNSRFPVWTRDGTRVVFQSDREGDAGIFWQPVTGGAAERLTKPEAGTSHIPEAWSPSADVLLYSLAMGSTYSSWSYSLADRTASPFGDIETSFFPINATFSPDGRWVAYQAGESGSGEAILYVQPFPVTGTKHQIARGGRPLWSPDGKRLFFIPGPGQFQSVSVTGEGTFEFTPPESVPRRFGLAPPQAQRTFDILPDGRMIGLNTPPERERAAPTEIHVVLNWFEELKAKLPVPQ